MRFSDTDSSPTLSDSADARRIDQYIEACQAAVDAWAVEDAWLADGDWHWQSGRPNLASDAWQRAGKANADARIAMHTADSLL